MTPETLSIISLFCSIATILYVFFKTDEKPYSLEEDKKIIKKFSIQTLAEHCQYLSHIAKQTKAETESILNSVEDRKTKIENFFKEQEEELLFWSDNLKKEQEEIKQKANKNFHNINEELSSLKNKIKLLIEETNKIPKLNKKIIPSPSSKDHSSRL